MIQQLDHWSGLAGPPPQLALSPRAGADLRDAIWSDQFHSACPAPSLPLETSAAPPMPPPSSRSMQGETAFYYSWAVGYQRFPRTAHVSGLWELQQNAQPYIGESEAMPAHSLGQLWALDHRGSCNSDVEMGWVVSPQQYGDSQPHLFIYAWDCGVGLGYVGQSAIPWVQRSSVIAPNMALSQGSALHLYGVVLKGGNWWFNYDRQWVGYIPASAWTRKFPAAIEEAQFGGEVASTEPEPCIAMGNEGHYGHHQRATLVAQAWHQHGRAKVEAELSGYSTDSKYTTGRWSHGQPGSKFRYGGPGWCAE